MVKFYRVSAIVLVLGLAVAGCSEKANWDAESVTESAIADLADHLAIPADQILISSPAQAVVWNSSAIGCAEPGRTYDGGEVSGFVVILGYFDQMYPYHQGGDQPPFLCPEPSE